MKFDLHTHTKYSSDGIIEPEKLVKTAIKRGLSGIAITDHDTLNGSLRAKEYKTDDLEVIVKLYQEGSQLIKKCTRELQSIENKIEVISNDSVEK